MIVDRERLKSINKKDLANHLGISTTTLWRKLNKEKVFTESEIEKIEELLKYER